MATGPTVRQRGGCIEEQDRPGHKYKSQTVVVRKAAQAIRRDLNFALRFAPPGIVVASYLITSDRRSISAPPVDLRRCLRVVALRAVDLQRRDVELFGNLTRCLGLREPVGVRVPTDNVAPFRAGREVGPLAGLGIYLERSEVFVGPRWVQRDVLVAFKPTAGNQLGE